MSWWYVGGIWIAAFVIALILPTERPRPTRFHSGLEMKARKGRLIYIRETESEREI